MTLLAVLVIGLAMVVVTARHVRASSATELTRKRVRALVDVTAALIERGVDPTLPLPATLPAGLIAAPDVGGVPGVDGAADRPSDREAQVAASNASELRERQLRDFAGRSARQLASALADVGGAAGPLAELGVGVGVTGPPEVLDAWDRPIALIPRPDPAVGMAPDDDPFFVSAGPDGRFLTLSDNIYSYDLPALLPRPGRPTTRPDTQ